MNEKKIIEDNRVLCNFAVIAKDKSISIKKWMILSDRSDKYLFSSSSEFHNLRKLRLNKHLDKKKLLPYQNRISALLKY